jgi:Zn-dependent M28 family amino/carboxypeptidase
MLMVPGESQKSNLTNIIARFNPDAEKQILLGAHWDTRPWADQDFELQSKPVLGANDGASGVAVLLELADILSKAPTSVGVTIVLFDAEDFGSAGNPKSFARGSQYFAKHLPIPKPEYAIILDMVGDAELNLLIERNSFRQNRQLVKELWALAKDLQLPAFLPSIRHTIFDDHVPLYEFAGIPAIDIIDFDYPNAHQNYWHTHQDTPDKCSPESLEQIGTLLVHHIYGIK